MVPDILRQCSGLKTSGTDYPVTRCHIPEEFNLQLHSCENLKTQVYYNMTLIFLHIRKKLSDRGEVCLPNFFSNLCLVCGNKMPTRCNRWFYCRSYCLLIMFREPLCPSSGAREYYTGGCRLSYLVLWFSSCRYGVERRVVCPVCGQSTKYHRQQPPL